MRIASLVLLSGLVLLSTDPAPADLRADHGLRNGLMGGSKFFRAMPL